MADEIKNFMRGAKPTPRHKLMATMPFRPWLGAPLPDHVAYVPPQLAMWGNDTYGDCVSAEEAFNKDVSGVFLSNSTVTSWASKNGFLNGADLLEVMQAMQKSGFPDGGGNTYGDGEPLSVDYSNEQVLQAALAIAPVKIGIDANALPSGAGSKNGFYGFPTSVGNYNNEDHCIAICGYGTAAQMFAALKLAVPSGVDGTQGAYLIFTWSTIGVVNHNWIMSTVGEAWLRNPSSTKNGQPMPNPGPQPVPPPPPPPPTPTPSPWPWWAWLLIGAGAAGVLALLLKAL